MCGENYVIIYIGYHITGSPPRVRGKPINEGRARKVSRITPACAGKTGTDAKLDAISEDHPRVCGEN